MPVTLKEYDAYKCPVELTIELINGRWKSIILYLVQNGVNRFGMLHKMMPGISKKVLTSQLKALERRGLLYRDVIVNKPPKEIIYSLTAKGASLRGLVDEIFNWGIENLLDPEMKKEVNEIISANRSMHCPKKEV